MQANNSRSERASRAWTLVSEAQQVSVFARNRVLLAGEVVFISTREVTMPGFVSLAARRGAPWWSALLKRQHRQLHVAVASVVHRHAAKARGCALAVDAYLRWGMRTRGKLLLIGGCEGRESTSLDLLLFENGNLLDYESKTLPSRSAAHFGTMLATLLDEYAERWPGCKICQAPPLSPFGTAFPAVEYLGAQVFHRLRFLPLAQQHGGRRGRWLLPALLVGAGLFTYLGMLAKGGLDYREAHQRFIHERDDPVLANLGGIDTGLIDTIQQRKFFLDAEREQQATVARLQMVVNGLSDIGELKVLELRLPQAAPDPKLERESQGAVVWLRVSVPLQHGSAMEHGRELMQKISARTGLDMRLARQGWSEDGQRRYFTVEGFVHA